ncbi:MAG: YkvA family protein [Lyngbya sp.]|nr:YkvA family protein [Lyngbya sp.]
MRISIQALYNLYRTVIRNPKYRGWVILGTLVYLLSPLDISPDLIPILGQVDDVVLLTILFSEVYQMFIDYTRSLTGQTSEENPNTEVNQSSSSGSTVVDVEAETLE